MNKSFMFLFVILFWSCTENIGTIAFQETVESDFSNFIQNIGTFSFKQKYSPGLDPNNIMTSLKVVTSAQTILEYEIFAFKNENHTYGNIIFISRDSILTNQQDFKQIDSQGGFLLNNEKVQISIFKRNINDTINKISGHYEGISKLITPLEEQEDTFEIFTLFGNIDYNNLVVLYPTNIIEGFDRLEGNYNNANEFSGNVFFNNIETGTITNNSSNFTFNNTTLKDSLFLKINNVEKKIALTINKIN